MVARPPRDDVAETGATGTLPPAAVPFRAFLTGVFRDRHGRGARVVLFDNNCLGQNAKVRRHVTWFVTQLPRNMGVYRRLPRATLVTRIAPSH
jgi:hypothetical protein